MSSNVVIGAIMGQWTTLGSTRWRFERCLHMCYQRKKSTSQQQALQRAQKLAEKTLKNATSKPQSRKKERKDRGCSISQIDNDHDEDLQDHTRVQDAHAKLLQAQAPIQAFTKPKNKTRVGKIQAGMSIKRGCQCNFVAKQLLLDESLCTIHFHCMTHTNKDDKPCHGTEFGGQRAGLSGRLSTTTKQWIVHTLRSRKSPAQVMAEHKSMVMQGACSKFFGCKQTQGNNQGKLKR